MFFIVDIFIFDFFVVVVTTTSNIVLVSSLQHSDSKFYNLRRATSDFKGLSVTGLYGRDVCGLQSLKYYLALYRNSSPTPAQQGFLPEA